MIFALLTVLTQIGGLAYLFSLFTFRRATNNRTLKRTGVVIGSYVMLTFLLVPLVAPIFGREKIKNSDFVQPHNLFYVLANRNYVRPELNKVIATVANKLDDSNAGIKLIYLDANFPFFDGYPMLPHLSHNDGKKLDVTFVYQNASGRSTNLKRSRSGYGIYEEPIKGEPDQPRDCKTSGYWQYDFPKYLTFGEVHRGIELDEEVTRELVELVVAEHTVGKLFIEPHLKERMALTNGKIRFHGCQAVGHDDHIHFQLE